MFSSEQNGQIVALNKLAKWSLPVFLGLTFLLYGNTLNHQFVVDDEVVFTENQFVQNGLNGITDIFNHGFMYGYAKESTESYRPLPLAIFAIVKHFFGNNPFIGHLINVLIYAFSISLLFSWLRLIMAKISIWAPWIISLLFLAHPIHTEVVANIKSLDEILSFVFGMLTLLFIWKGKFGKLKYLFLATISLFLGLLSKEHTITIIAISPLMLWFFGEMDIKDALKSSSVLIIPTLIYLAIRSTVLDTMTFNEENDVIQNTLFAAGNLSQQWSTSIEILGKYLQLLVFPWELSHDYGHPSFSISNWDNLSVFVSLISWLGLAVYSLWKARDKGVASFGIIFLMVTFSLTSNLFLLINCTLGERFLFLPSVGFCILIGMLLIHLNKRFGKEKHILLISILLPILFLYSWKTEERNKDWKDNLTLFKKDVETVPKSARLHLGLAGSYRKLAKDNSNIEFLDKAVISYNTAIALYPEYFKAHYNLANCYYQKQSFQKSADHLKIAYALRPKFPEIERELATALTSAKRWDEANPIWEKLSANSMNQTYKIAWSNSLTGRAVYQAQEGNVKAAQSDFDKAIKIAPNNAVAYGDRAVFYINQEQWEAALKDLNKAIKVDSNNAEYYNSIGYVYIQMKRYELALHNLDHAIKLKPSHAFALSNRGQLYWRTGNFTKALIDLKKSLSMVPDNAQALYFLGRTQMDTDKVEEACASLKNAIEKDLSTPLKEIAAGWIAKNCS